MKNDAFLASLMNFNKRVLELGNVIYDPSYTANDLMEKLFFNEIFWKNMQEAFQRYDCRIIMDDYIESLWVYQGNIEKIKQMLLLVDKHISIESPGSFDQRLITARLGIRDQLIYDYFHYQSYRRESIRWKWMDDVIYYLTWDYENKAFFIAYIDPKREIYSKPVSLTNGKRTLYWKTDEVITDYLNIFHEPSTISFRVTTQPDKDMNGYDTRKVVKVEYNGSTKDAGLLPDIFKNSNPLIISNNAIYINDLKQIIKMRIKKVENKGRDVDYFNLNHLFYHDTLVEYPKVSFQHYLNFLEASVNNDDVDEIYLALYRIGDDPTIFKILEKAINNKKYVHVNIELCASGESINLFWKKEMERIGITVTNYQNEVVKVHTKLTMVKFNDGRYLTQIGTGNYHPVTTNQYTDLSFITSDASIGNQVEYLFKLFRGEVNGSFFNDDFLVTRFNTRKVLRELIEEEAKKGPDGYICIKCNALDDKEISNALTKAAKAKCRIEMIIRGVCTWTPDELGDNVLIKSIIWDLLEHSRIYTFGRKNPTIYIGSLDPVTNKLDKRIETLVRIKDPYILREICNNINRYITNTGNSWRLLRNGEYVKEE